MPVMDGYEATRAIRKGDAGKSNHAIPIIALTARATLGEAERAKSVGCDAYLKKPIDTRQLPQIIRQFL